MANSSERMFQVYYLGEYMGLVRAIPTQASLQAINLIKLKYPNQIINSKDVVIDDKNHQQFAHMMKP